MIKLVVTKHRDAIYKYEKLGKYTNKEYLTANTEFANRHIRQIPPLIDNEPKREFGKHVYEAMWGPTEFTVRGSLKDWSGAFYFFNSFTLMEIIRQRLYILPL